jgi:hypothetical protein
MFSSAKTSYRNKPRRPLRYVGFLLLVPFFLIGALFVLSSVRVVPPISTKVVDAITGKPVPGMSVCLQVEGMNLGGLEGLRTDYVADQRLGQGILLALRPRELAAGMEGILDQSDRSRRADCPAMRILYRMDGLKGKRMAY